MTEEFFPLKKSPSAHTLQEVACLCQSQQSRQEFSSVNKDGLPRELSLKNYTTTLEFTPKHNKAETFPVLEDGRYSMDT